MRDAEHAITRRGSAGVEAARAFGDDLLGGARHLQRSTRTLLAERPLETLLVIGIAGFAIGWIARRARDLHLQHVQRPAPAQRPATARAGGRPRSRATK
ncbi:MAG: hypothetical protein GXC76_15460 [Rhodanobacteraceae bacterium]|nr:hypothetical protein [Rhodanobacteraceae bacterium]